MKLLGMPTLGAMRLQILGKHLLFCFVLTACFASPAAIDAAEQKPPTGVRSVQLVQHEDGAMVVYSVILDRRFEADELDTLSHRIKRGAPKTKLVLISYFLRGMRAQDEAWATSHFDPSLGSFVVRINETITATNPPDRDLRVSAVGRENDRSLPTGSAR